MDEYIIKYCQGELSEDEETALLKEAYRDPDLKNLIIKYQHLYYLTKLQPAVADIPLGESKYKLFKQQMDRLARRTFILKWGRYAAIFIIALVSSWILAYYYYSPDGEPEMIAMQQELHVPAGQRAELTLPDGSKVWLNAGSRLSYPSFFTKERKVFLSGEGFFDVAKNEKVPFIVSTQTIDIKALGTQFNVYSYPGTGRTEVYLMEGIVKSYYPAAEAEGLILSPGQLLVQEGGRFELTTMEPDRLLWREGIYVFKRQKLKDIIRQLELYYDVKIIVKDPEILEYEYVGKFRQKDGVMTILQLIQKIHKYNIEKNDDLNQITLFKQPD